MNRFEDKAKKVIAEWRALCGGCLKPNISDVPLSLLTGYIRRALQDEQKTCVALVKAALESGDDRDFDWGKKLLKKMRSLSEKMGSLSEKI